MKTIKVFAGSSSAPQDMENFEIDEVMRRELLKMDADEKNFTVVFFHGFVSGKENAITL
jgi:hypothetical protein